MNYNEFLEVINHSDFNKNTYDALILNYGFDLINKFFSKFLSSPNLSEEDYDKCKYYLEDEFNSFEEDYSNYKDLSALNIYLDEIGKYELLSSSEQKSILIKLDELKNTINKYNELYNIKELIDSYGKDLNKLIDSKDKNLIIIKDYLEKQKEYKVLFEKLFHANLRLVVRVANHYNTSNMDLLDMIQEGNIGLHVAIERFDISKGNKFSTYAIWWIRQHIVRDIQQSCRIIRLPYNKNELIYKVKRATNMFEKEYNRLPSNQEIVDYINKKVKERLLKPSRYYKNLTADTIEELKKINQSVTSLNVPIGEDDENTLENFIVDYEQDSIENIVGKNLISEDINLLLKQTNPRYRLVVILRFGLALNKYMSYEEFLSCFYQLDFSEEYYQTLYNKLCRCVEPFTLEDVGKVLNVTRERIRQMEAKTLRILISKNKREKILQPDSLELYK